MACLVLLSAPTRATFVVSPSAQTTLGRSAGCSIRLVDPGVSRRHARVVRARLRDADVLRLGHAVLRFATHGLPPLPCAFA